MKTKKQQYNIKRNKVFKTLKIEKDLFYKLKMLEVYMKLKRYTDVIRALIKFYDKNNGRNKKSQRS